jgi:hypothetical protein
MVRQRLLDCLVFLGGVDFRSTSDTKVSSAVGIRNRMIALFLGSGTTYSIVELLSKTQKL